MSSAVERETQRLQEASYRQWDTMSEARVLTTSTESTSPIIVPAPAETPVAPDAYRGYHHIHWYVGNAKQAASWYVTRMGFKLIACRGLETGSRNIASWVVGNGTVRFVLSSPIRSKKQLMAICEELVHEMPTQESLDIEKAMAMHEQIQIHGDAVCNVAFEVDDVQAILSSMQMKGLKVAPAYELSDESGTVAIGHIHGFGNVGHSLIQHNGYKGAFLPGYVAVSKDAAEDKINLILPPVKLEALDHCVGNQDWDDLDKTCRYYERVLGFRRFWSVDDTAEHSTDLSAMRLITMASPNESIKMPICEPAKGVKMSQVEEYNEYNDGEGIAHIAFRTDNIIEALTNMKTRGVEFITIPGSYYELMKERLERTGVVLAEDLEVLEELGVLVDFDEGGYLLQTFTKPLLDRPTVFLEIIQRHNFSGFGAGNVRSLFEAVEREQAKRGNL